MREAGEGVRQAAASVAYPVGIDAGDDGQIWFAQPGAGPDAVGRIGTDGQYDPVHIPVPPNATEGDSGGHTTSDVVVAPDGAYG